MAKFIGRLIIVALLIWFVIRFATVGGDPLSAETYRLVGLSMVSDAQWTLDFIKSRLGSG